MKRMTLQKYTYATMSAASALAIGATMIWSGSAAAATNTTAANTTLTTDQQTHLQLIISKGNQEITRRLTTLGTLAAKISAATKLTTGDQATLSSEVSTTTSGLTSLEAQLDGEVTLTGARTDAQNIYTEYRVYALVAPKVNLIKVADDQQVVEAKLQTLEQKLQARITADQQAGKNVSNLQTILTDLTTKVTAAQQISSSIESKVIGLQPSDYNSDHTILVGDSTQLQTAHSDNAAAYTDAKNIINGLKAL